MAADTDRTTVKSVLIFHVMREPTGLSPTDRFEVPVIKFFYLWRLLPPFGKFYRDLLTESNHFSVFP